MTEPNNGNEEIGKINMLRAELEAARAHSRALEKTLFAMRGQRDWYADELEKARAQIATLRGFSRVLRDVARALESYQGEKP